MSLDIQPVLIFADGTPVSALNPLPTTGGGGGGGTVTQGAANGDATKGWSARLTDGAAFIVPAKTGQLPAALGATTAAGSVSVGIATDQLSTLATAAKQDAGNASLASIDAKLTAPLSVIVAPGNTVSAANSSTTPLAGAGTFTGTGVDLLAYAGVEVFAFSDVAGTLILEYSTNNTNWDLSISVPLAAGTSRNFPNGAQARYFRVRYVNGGSAQSVFRLQTLLLGTIPAPHTVPIGSVPVSGNDAVLTQAEIIGLSSSGGGTYVPVKVSPSGAVQVGGEVSISGWLGSTAPTVGQKTAANSLPVVLASDIGTVTDGTNTAAVKASSTAPAAADAALVVTQNPVAPAHTPTLSFVNSSASSVTLLAANSARKQASFFNTSTADLYLREDGGAATTTTGFTVLLRASGGYYELPVGAHGSITTGTITGIWTAAGSGGCAVTERA